MLEFVSLRLGWGFRVEGVLSRVGEGFWGLEVFLYTVIEDRSLEFKDVLFNFVWFGGIN